MKQIKRIMAAVAAAAVLISTSGCKTKNYDDLLDRNNPVTITIWHYYNGVQQTQFDEMVSEFNNTVGAEKGVFVEAFSKNSINELAASVIASVNGDPGAEAPPDIFGTYAETAYQIHKMGKLADLGKYVSESTRAEYVDEYIAEGTFGNEFVIFPTAKSTEVFILNTTDWSAFAAAEGLDYSSFSTWEGLVEVAEKYYKYTDALTPDIPDDGKAFFGRDAVANYMFIGAMQLGHPFAVENSDGTVTVSADKETVRKLWDCFYVPYVKGRFSGESRFRSDDAKIGSIIALVCSTTGAAYYPKTVTVNDDLTHPIDNVVLNVPNFADTQNTIVQQGAGMSVIASAEKDEYAAAVFLEWFTEEERNIRFSVNSGYLPVKKSANSSDKLTSDEISPIMQSTLSRATEEINSYKLYTSPPYDRSADVRSFVGDYMESTAKQAAAQARSSGSVSAAAAALTDDAAFEKWFEEFESGLKNCMN